MDPPRHPLRAQDIRGTRARKRTWADDMSLTCAVVLSCTCVMFAASLANSALIAGSQTEALMDLKQQMNDNLRLNSWQTSNDCSAWNYVSCDGAGNVVAINLQWNWMGWSGTLPDSISKLTSLIELNLAGNHLSGSIPASIGALSLLQFLCIAGNALDGTLPEALGALQSLTFLDLSGNVITGSIPASFSGLRRVQMIHLGTNQLGGSLPKIFDGLEQLTRLEVNRNKISGEIPPSISAMKNIRILELSDNQLTGSIPNSISSLTLLDFMSLGQNQFTGTIPVALGYLTRLTWLGLSWNQITGRIPDSIGALTNLQHLHVPHNQLTGSIPASIGALTKLQELDLSVNQLNGSFPASISSLTNLQHLWMYDLQLNGSIPASIGSLTKLKKLYLTGDQLTGSIPASFGNLKNLQELHVWGDQLTGTLPTTLMTLTALIALNVDDNFACPPSNTLCPGKPATNTTPFCTIRCTAFCSTCMEAYPPPSPPPPLIVKKPPPPKPKTSPPPKPPPPASKPQPPPKSPPRISKSPPPFPPPLPPPKKPPPPRRPPPRSPPPPPPTVRTYGFNASATPMTRNLNGNVFRHASIGYNYPINNWRIDSSTDWTASTNRLGASAAPDVRDQSSCGACWAFAAVGAVSSAAKIAFAHFQVVPNLSVQQVVSCATTSSGCRSGMPASALDYIAEYTRNSSSGSARGLFPDSCFKYKSSSVACQLPTPTSLCKPSAYGVSMWEQVDFNGWFGLLLTVQQQPAVVTLYAECPAFLGYSSGIFQDPSGLCDRIPNHAVLVVGYVLNSGVPYWIIQNSWGTGWGIEGRMRIAITGSYGLCNMHLGPAFYPVMKLSDPCSSDFNFNPCGSGRCTKTGPDSNTCECQDPFVNVTNVDGRTQSCIPKAVCSFFMFNPCALGTCVNDGLGGYSCICPPGFKVSEHATDSSDTCIADSASQPRQYLVASAGVSCAALAAAYGLSVDNLVKQNSQLQPPLNCTEPYIAIKTVVNVTQPTALGTCSVLYAWTQDDHCEVVSDRFMLGGIQNLETMNPWLNCIDGPFPQPGMQICVQKGMLPATLPSCTAYYSVKNDDTCETIQAQYNIDVFRFYALNPGINCDRLSGTASSDIGDVYSNQQVCLSAPISQGICKEGSRERSIMAGDTCTSLIQRFFTSPGSFAYWNYGWVCKQSGLYPSKKICVPNPTPQRSPPPIPKPGLLNDLGEI